MKLLTVLSVSLIILSVFAFVAPSPALATSNNNRFIQSFNNWRNSFRRDDDRNDHCRRNPHDRKCRRDDDDKNDCRRHPERNECHVSVPEFGAIPGLVAAVTSAGSFFLLKRKIG